MCSMICHNVDTCTLKTEQNSYKENKKLLAILISYISQIDLLDTGSSSASPIVAIARCGVSAGLCPISDTPRIENGSSDRGSATMDGTSWKD